MKSEKFRFHLFLATLKMALVAYTLRHKNATFTEKYPDRVHSYYNSNFKIHEEKLKTKTV